MDANLFSWINSHHNAFLDALLWWMSAAADLYLIWWAAAVAALLAGGKKGRRVFLGIALSLGLVYISVDLVMKPLVARPRPFEVIEGVRKFHVSIADRFLGQSFSFPSGHCASSMAAAIILGRAYRKIRLPLAILVAMIAYSRVYLGVHYPMDCLAGLAWGALCGVAVVVLGARYLPETAGAAG